MIELRDYQKKIIVDLRGALTSGSMAPAVVAPTGSGKTVIFAFIGSRHIEKSGRVLFLVHRREILEQTIKKLFEFGVTCGQVASGRPMTSDPAQVAMVGTLVRRLDLVRKPTLIIIDECHHTPAKQWRKILDYFYDVPKIGFTATPERLDGQGIGDIFDNMIQGPSISELVDSGFLARPRMFSSNLPEKDFKITRGDYDLKQQSEVMTDRVIVGNVIEHYRQFLNGLPAVCFCVSIRHCEVMEAQFNAAGIRARTITGKMHGRDRDAAIKGLADGTIQILCSCDVISEGVDVPIMAGAIMLRKTLSLALFLQQAGRPLRIYPGKKDAIILDHCGNFHLHGHVLAPRQWDLHSEKRKRRKEKEPEITRCPKCFYIMPGKPNKCEVCGHDFIGKKRADNMVKIREVEGILRECLPDHVTESERVSLAAFAARIQSMDKPTRQKAMWAKAFELRDRDKIEALRAAVGYKRGWTRIVWERVERDIKKRMTS